MSNFWIFTFVSYIRDFGQVRAPLANHRSDASVFKNTLISSVLTRRRKMRTNVDIQLKLNIILSNGLSERNKH